MVKYRQKSVRLAAEPQKTQANRHADTNSNAVKSCLPIANLGTRIFGRDDDDQPVTFMGSGDDGLGFVVGILAHQENFKTQDSGHGDQQREIPVAGMGRRDQHIFRFCRRLANDFPAGQFESCP